MGLGKLRLNKLFFEDGHIFGSGLGRLISCAAAIVILTFAGCSQEKAPEDDFSVTMVPNEPLVNTVSGKRFVGFSDGLPQYEELKDNWIQFRLNLKNGTDKTITINGLKVKARFVDKTGQEKKAEVVFTPGDFNKVDPFWMELAPGAEVPMGFDGNSAIFYLTGLPKDEGQETFTYVLSVEPLGWFGTFDDPQDRFSKSEIFVTR